MLHLIAMKQTALELFCKLFISRSVVFNRKKVTYNVKINKSLL